MLRLSWKPMLMGTAVALLLGCENLFNPNGATASAELNADGLIQQGELYLRQSRNYDAYIAFQQAIEKDSTKSTAYYGMAKASLRRYNVNPLELMKILASVQSSDGADPLTVVADYLIVKLRDTAGFGNAIDTMQKSLAPFYRRDSLNSLYLAYEAKYINQKTLSKTQDSIADAFRTEYENPSSATPGKYVLADFPLMDGKITSARLNAERNVGRAVSMMQSVNKLFSAYENVEDITNDISALADGSKQLSDLKIFQDALNDSTARNNLNANIAELSKDVNKLKEVASQFTSVSSDPNAQSADSAIQSASSDSTLQKQIDELGPAVAFYKISDGSDNDGDGCVDEEIYDSKDNDGDGFTDEDIRGTLMTANDLKDNDLDGQIDEADELFALDGTLLFTQSPSYVVGPKYTDKSTKVAYSIDTTFATYSISTRKTQLGACWK